MSGLIRRIPFLLIKIILAIQELGCLVPRTTKNLSQTDFIVQKSSKDSLAKFLKAQTFENILDVPSGNGWLRKVFAPEVTVDGIDLFEEKPKDYKRFLEL